MPNWKTIETPIGAFIGWGKKGQEVTVRIFELTAEGGKNFQGNPCPRLVGTLVEDATNYVNLRKNPEAIKLDAGDMVTVEGGTANLKRALLELIAQGAKRDDLTRITYEDTYETSDGNEGKAFKVEHAPASDNSVSEDDL